MMPSFIPGLHRAQDRVKAGQVMTSLVSLARSDQVMAFWEFALVTSRIFSDFMQTVITKVTPLHLGSPWGLASRGGWTIAVES